MLLLKVMNTGGSETQATYDVEAYINTRRIYSGTVSAHNRGDGWIKLIQKAMAEANENQEEVVGSRTCPVCNSSVVLVNRHKQ
jgi:hypothetical protein